MPNDDNFHLEYNLAALVAHQVTFNRLLRGESNLRPPWYTSVKKKLGIRRVKVTTPWAGIGENMRFSSHQERLTE